MAGVWAAPAGGTLDKVTSVAMTRARWAVLSVCAIGLSLGLAAVFWLGVYDNYHPVVEGELYRCGQMSPAGLRRRLTADRIATVINLRPETNETWWAEETRICREMGVTHVDVPLAGDRPPTAARIEALVNAMRSAAKPALVHCEHGADRTSFASALYLLAVKGAPYETARRAFSPRYGHLPWVFRSVECFDTAFREVRERR